MNQLYIRNLKNGNIDILYLYIILLDLIDKMDIYKMLNLPDPLTIDTEDSEWYVKVLEISKKITNVLEIEHYKANRQVLPDLVMDLLNQYSLRINQINEYVDPISSETEVTLSAFGERLRSLYRSVLPISDARILRTGKKLELSGNFSREDSSKYQRIYINPEIQKRLSFILTRVRSMINTEMTRNAILENVRTLDINIDDVRLDYILMRIYHNDRYIDKFSLNRQIALDSNNHIVKTYSDRVFEAVIQFIQENDDEQLAPQGWHTYSEILEIVIRPNNSGRAIGPERFERVLESAKMLLSCQAENPNWKDHIKYRISYKQNKKYLHYSPKMQELILNALLHDCDRRVTGNKDQRSRRPKMVVRNGLLQY